MHLAPVQLFIWYLSTFLAIVLCVLLFARKLHVRFPVFTVFIASLIAREALLYAVYRASGVSSRSYFYSYLGAELFMVLQAACIAELASGIASRPFSGLRICFRLILTRLGPVLLLLTAVNVSSKAPASMHTILLYLERDLSLVWA
jgi:hypothetical protein